MAFRPNNKHVVDGKGRGHTAGVELVFGDDFKGPTGLEYPAGTVLGETVDPAFREYG